MNADVQTAHYLRRERRLLTPEGVDLRIELADPGERLGAFLVDVTASTLAAVLIQVAGMILWSGPSNPLSFTLPVTLFLAFLIRNLWFILFELNWGGSTPGKRIFGLRVINRHGGPLLHDAVIARNITRQAEFFFPIELLLVTNGWLWSAGEAVPAALWLGAMFALLFATKDRQRAGDLLAGTVVISIPKRRLLEDLARESLRVQFSDAQMQVYGVLELQVLEEVLRRPMNGDTDRLIQDVALRIQRRIGWDPKLYSLAPFQFLSDFYTAQRAFLEDRKNLGEERLDKFHHQKD